MKYPRLILFLDSDNRILSPAAEVVFRSKLESIGTKAITIVSAGVINEGFVSRDEQMDALLAETGLHIDGIVTPLSLVLLEYADWVVYMDDLSCNCRQLQRVSDSRKRIMDFPTKGTLTNLLKESPFDYVRIYEEIEKGCQALLAKIE